MKTYTNETKGKQKVYIDGNVGPFKILEPGESCEVRLDVDQEVLALDIAPEPEQKKATKKK